MHEQLTSDEKPKYEVSAEIKEWIDQNYPLLYGEDRLVDHKKWTALEDEFLKRAAASKEFKLEYLRRMKDFERHGSGELEELEGYFEFIRQKKEQAERDSKEAQFPKNLLTNYDDTLRAISMIEGFSEESWRASESEEGQTAFSALKRIEMLKNMGASNSASAIFTIWGGAGLNRYFVYMDGTVKFSGGHSLSENRERARRMGFEVQGGRNP
jgi:hypothetical protein